MWTKYDYMPSSQLRAELRRRGYQPYANGKSNTHSYKMRCLLIEDDKKKNKPIPYIEDAQTQKERNNNGSGNNVEQS
jgi:hypothetical protein